MSDEKKTEMPDKSEVDETTVEIEVADGEASEGTEPANEEGEKTEGKEASGEDAPETEAVEGEVNTSASNPGKPDKFRITIGDTTFAYESEEDCPDDVKAQAEAYEETMKADEEKRKAEAESEGESDESSEGE